MLLIIVLAAFFGVFSLADMYTDFDLSGLLAIITFLFAIFVGFFISRQGQRYSKIRTLLGRFHGNTSALFRLSTHLTPGDHDAISEIIKREYTNFLSTDAWDDYFSKKSTYLTDVHKVLDRAEVSRPAQTSALMQIFATTRDMQLTRKELLALQRERIPVMQWVLVYLLGGMLIATLATISGPSALALLIVKSACATIVLITIMMLHSFASLTFFEHTIGESTSRDVLDILENKK